MKSFTQNIIFVLSLASAFLGLAPVSCERPSETKKTSPASVANPVVETSLTTITLSERAEERLGVETTKAEFQQISDVLEVGGEIMAPPGKALTIAAPAAGTVLHSDGPAIQAGSIIKKGQSVLRLMLMPPGLDLMGAREQVAVKQADYDVAAAKKQRAEELLKDRAISEKVYQEAQAGFAAANANLKAAKAKLDMMSGASLDAGAEDLSVLVLESPIDGVIQQLFVAHGQTVSASTVLFEVVSQNPVWVRVPVYTGLLDQIDKNQKAIIYSLGRASDETTIYADAIDGPLLSNVTSASSDLFYKIDNSSRAFRIGDRVQAQLLKKSSVRSIVVPWSAVVYDINGGTWVYIQTAPHTFARRRVEVSKTVDDLAVIARGLGGGEDVVVVAVAELYGTEFGGGK
jgi:RND family efflux transporter MFP subunit